VFDLHVEGEAEVRRSDMSTQKYRTVVAAVLAGVVLCSPLLCGMSCFERNAATEMAGPEAGKFIRGFVEMGAMGCEVWHITSRINEADWAETARVCAWVGIETVRLIGDEVRVKE
jgi:hypothetical protein